MVQDDTPEQADTIEGGIMVREMIRARENGVCPFCKKPVDINEFRDELSLREYRISGLCQSCQDDFFEA